MYLNRDCIFYRIDIGCWILVAGIEEEGSSGQHPILRIEQRNHMDYFLCVIGMVMIIEGLPYFAFPEKMKYWVRKVLELPEGSLRRFGLVLMVAGLFLVYAGKR
jgi:uncharacterized protein YjeT (DUF2065 family)